MRASNQKYFFIEGKKQISIQEFDYEYILNSFAFVYDMTTTEKRDYFVEVVVSKTFDANGDVAFDVRRLNLNEIFYDTIHLRALNMLIDDILFGKKNPSGYRPNMPLPKLKQEYVDWKAGKEIKAPAIIPEGTENIMPSVRELVRVEISETDPRLEELATVAELQTEFELHPMQALEWVENFEICSSELTIEIQKMSSEQMRLVQLMKTNSEFINGIFVSVSSALQQAFPIKPSVIKRILGRTDFVVKQDEIQEIFDALNSAVSVDTSRFSGIETVFEDLSTSLNNLKLNIEHGIAACNYVMETSEDAYEFEIRHERLMKVRAVAGSTELSLRNSHMKFVVNYNNLVETQTVIIPLLINRLQSLTGDVVDDDTVEIIKSLASAKVEK